MPGEGAAARGRRAALAKGGGERCGRCRCWRQVASGAHKQFTSTSKLLAAGRAWVCGPCLRAGPGQLPAQRPCTFPTRIPGAHDKACRQRPVAGRERPGARQPSQSYGDQQQPQHLAGVVYEARRAALSAARTAQRAIRVPHEVSEASLARLKWGTQLSRPTLHAIQSAGSAAAFAAVPFGHRIPPAQRQSSGVASPPGGQGVCAWLLTPTSMNVDEQHALGTRTGCLLRKQHTHARANCLQERWASGGWRGKAVGGW